MRVLVALASFGAASASADDKVLVGQTSGASAAAGGATTPVSAAILRAVWAALESIMCF